MNFLVLFYLTAAVLSAPSCDNPLFSVANWPSDLMRPDYLTTPQTITTSTFCGAAQSGSAQTCCAAGATDQIATLYHSRSDAMKQRGEQLEGGVRDTFNDFDPQNQQGGGRLLQNGSTNSTRPQGPPPRDSRPDGFNNADVPDANMTSAEPPKGRGAERNRPGINKMSAAGKEAIANITRTMNALMKQYAYNMGKCMKGQLNHLAGMLCMGCDPDWANWVSADGTSVTVQISDAACNDLADACLEYVKQAQSLPTLIDSMKASIQAVVDSEIAAGTITAADVPTNDLSSQTKPPAQVVPVCSTDDACRTYICEVMSKGKGIAPEPATVADPASVSTTSGRLLAASVVFKISSSGYNSISQGTAVTATFADASSFNIDGVSTDVAPLTTDDYAVYLVAGLFALVF